MISIISNIKIKSSVLAFYVGTIQFILYNYIQNYTGDCFKTISLHLVKPVEEPVLFKEK